MQNKKKKNFASMDLPLTKNGFTFITTLLMISILALTLPFLSYSLQIIHVNNNYDTLSIHEFYRFLRDEILVSRTLTINDNKLYLTQELKENSDGDIVTQVATISHYNSLIRRQVNNVGHEVLLFDVSQITFLEHPYGLKIILVDLKGKTYEKIFMFYN